MHTLHAVSLRDAHFTMDGISEKTMREHYKLYEGYVKKYNEIVEKIAALQDSDYDLANQTYSLLRSLKMELTFALGGVKNHEIYFGHLGGDGGKPVGALLSQIEKDFGSYEKWEKDLRATALCARGWVWLAWDYDYKYLFHYLGDAQNTYPVWNAVPILALDTYEHAYFIDYGTARSAYVDAFLRNLNWDVVYDNFAHVLGCGCSDGCLCGDACSCDSDCSCGDGCACGK